MMAETMSLLFTFTASVSLASSGTYNIIFKMLVRTIKCFPSVRRSAKCFMWINSFHPKNSPVKSLILSCPFSLIRKHRIRNVKLLVQSHLIVMGWSQVWSLDYLTVEIFTKKWINEWMNGIFFSLPKIKLF